MRERFCATDTPGRRKALAKLLPYQREDFVGFFKAMKGLPVTVRLLDPRSMSFCRTTKRTRRRWPRLGLTLSK